MLNKVLIFLCFSIINLSSYSQSVEWASNVIEFSSELSPVEYSANQALGKPNVYPNGGQNPNAWLPKKNNKEAYLKVGFSKHIHVQQIAIAESLNPSAVKTIYLYDENDKEYKVFSLKPAKIELSRRLINIFIDKTDYKVSALKLVIGGKEVEGYNSIDAIAVSDSQSPILIEVHLEDGINSEVDSDRLSENVNSIYKEKKPLISPDGKTLFFSRQNHPDNVGGVDDAEDIWYSEKDEVSGDWLKAKNLGTPLNSAGPNFVSSITPDGNSILVVLLGNVYKENGQMTEGVSLSSKTNDGWSKPKELLIDNYYNKSRNVDYYLANNRQVLLMSVQRDDSYGDRDLYVSFKKKNDQWTEPMNLGNDVNTALPEGSPFLAPDDKTLYFSTEGYAGFGGTDIYVTRRLDDSWQKWSEPQNMGPGINSRTDDAFFNISNDGEDAYFVRVISENDSDIFHINIPELYRPSAVVKIFGKVLNQETNEPMEAEIFYEKLPEGTEVGDIVSDPKTGKYEILIPIGANYGYLAKAKGFLSTSNNIKLEAVQKYQEIEKNFMMIPIKKDKSVVLNNIFFELGNTKLEESSYPELDRLVTMMKENPKLTIEISGHTDNVGSKKTNKTLSRKRAENVSKYLIINGIDKKRLNTVGYGSKYPIASNDEEEGRAKNRRVEFKILSNE